MFGEPPLDGPQRVGFLLMPKFSLMAFSAASEPLRVANWLSGKTLYEWWMLSEDENPVHASNHMPCVPDYAIEQIVECDMIIVCASFEPEVAATEKTLNWLRRMARAGSKLGSLDTGSYILASAGLLDGYQATIHWENLESFTELFPKVEPRQDIFVIDRNRFTSAGGTASLDMMLNLIRLQHGSELAQEVADEFIYNRIREANQAQIPQTSERMASANPYVIKAIELMENNIEDVLTIKAITDQISLSQKELERLFKRWLKTTPAAYYKRLRMARAWTLLQQTNLTILEISVRCGFNSQAHFSRAYTSWYGHSPSMDRRLNT